MTMNPLPPQAYTKETLGKAFAWLQSQSENIKEMATSPDILVGLYLKAKLNGDGCLDRPSIQNFKNELKSLAGMMGEFEVLEQAPPSAPTSVQSTINSPSAPHKVEPKPPQSGALDTRSISMIHEVKTELNLSSDNEALRLLIATGYKSLKRL